MGLCDTMEKRALDRVLGLDTSWSQPTETYLALSKADPTDTLIGLDEPTIGQYGYTRALIDTSEWSLPVASGGVAGTFETHNLNNFSFGRASGGDWGIMTHFVVFDHISSTSEDRGLVHGTLSQSKDIKRGDLVTFNSGTLVVQVG